MKVVYIAGKFTGSSPWQIQQNVRAAEAAGLEVATKLGAMPLIPHKNTENFHGLLSPEFWYAGTLELMRRCDAVYLFNHRDYLVSKGCKDEIEEAKRLGIPWFSALGDLRDWLEGKPLLPVIAAQNPSYKVTIKTSGEAKAGER